jgi:hypothetical protein
MRKLLFVNMFLLSSFLLTTIHTDAKENEDNSISKSLIDSSDIETLFKKGIVLKNEIEKKNH